MTPTTAGPPTGLPYLDDGGPVLAFAHRGGAHHPEVDGLENSLAAFRHAVALGYDYLETDVHATSDGVLLAFHDTVLDRVTDQVGEIGALTFDEVRRARIGGREQIPTLAELVEEFPTARFNIDLKTDAAVEPMVRFLADRGTELDGRVLVGSWSAKRLREFRALTGGAVPTSAAPAEVAAFYVLPTRLADRLTGGAVRAMQIPHRQGKLTVASSRFIRRMHAAGKHVHVWTIDDPDEMGVLLDRGVDGLMTDRTDILLDVLSARGLWRGQQ